MKRKFKRVLRVGQKPKPTQGQTAPRRPTQEARDGRFASAAPAVRTRPQATGRPTGGRHSEKQIAELAVRCLTADACGDPAPGGRCEAKLRGKPKHVGRGVRRDSHQRV